MQYNHDFYKHGAANSSSSGPSQASLNSFSLGGSSVIPVLNGSHREPVKDETISSNIKMGRNAVQKHIEIVEYLKRVHPDSRVTFVDFERELGINLNEDFQVLGMLKSNPKVDRETNSDGVLSFAYRAKYIIRNRQELFDAIIRTRTGIVLSEIKDCYPGVETDCDALIIGGDIIGVVSRELKSLVLHPRGQPFYTALGGTVTAKPGEQIVSTSVDLRPEVRRGEAVKVGESWYRVSSVIGSGASNEQIQRSVAPPSVTLDKDLSDKNVYLHKFDDKSLPLDGDFDAPVEFVGPCLRHGCTTDIKNAWKRTALADEMRRFEQDGAALHRELVVLNLVSKHLAAHGHGSSSGNAAGGGTNKRRSAGVNKRRKPRVVRASASNSLYGVNAHLRGTSLEQVLKETRDKNLAEDNGR